MCGNSPWVFRSSRRCAKPRPPGRGRWLPAAVARRPSIVDGAVVALAVTTVRPGVLSRTPKMPGSSGWSSTATRGWVSARKNSAAGASSSGYEGHDRADLPGGDRGNDEPRAIRAPHRDPVPGPHAEPVQGPGRRVALRRLARGT